MQQTPHHNTSPEELPEPRANYAPTTPDHAQVELGRELQHAQNIEKGFSTSVVSPVIDPQTIATTSTAVLGSQVPQSDKASPHSPEIADDADLIEKEWVVKAKHIVEQTKDDPFLQTREMNKMKADYLKKRYAKDLKLPED